MDVGKRNEKVDAYLEKAGKWRAEFERLRGIIGSSGLTEDLKWGAPCYTLDGRNVVLMHGFKDYCALLFFKGALMHDPEDILIQQTENVQSARHVRFTGLEQIERMENILKSYVQDAIAVERSGAKVEKKDTADYEVPEEFQKTLEDPDVKAAFDALTPGRQRAYLLYFSGAKQATTRQARIAKVLPKIMEGKGLND